MRASSSERGFVSAVITVLFVAAALVLCIRFFLSQNSNSTIETSVREKLSTKFAEQATPAEVATALLVNNITSVCVEDVVISANNIPPFTHLASDNGSGPVAGNHCLPDDAAYTSLISQADHVRTFRFITVNIDPNNVINQFIETGLGTEGEGAAANPSTDTTCFSGETPVLIGISKNIPQYKRIDLIKEGDVVLSVDELGYEASMLGSISVPESTRFVALKSIQKRLIPAKIEKVLVHNPPNEGAIKLSLSSGNITTTHSHPFMTYGLGWTSIGFLGSRDLLVSLNGDLSRIVSIEDIPAQMTLYNLSLRDDHTHTYFVLPNGASSPLWVHNATTQGNKSMSH